MVALSTKDRRKSDAQTAVGYAVELTRPWMLWSLLLLLPIAWYYYRSLSDFPRWQRFTSMISRSLVVCLLVLALAGLALLCPTTKQYVVVAVDRSLSIDEQATKKIDEFVSKTSQQVGENTLVFMNVASEATQVFDSTEELTKLDESQQRGTNLAAAIEMASAAMPPGKIGKIVLLTDGRQTTGDAVHAAATADTPISVVPLPVRDDPEVQVAETIAPAEVRQGEPFYVEVVVASNHDDEGYIDVYRGDILVSQQKEPFKIKAGETRFRFRQSIDNESQTDYVVRIRDFEDTLLDNNSASAVVFAAGKPSVLVVDSDLKETNHFRWALEEQDNAGRSLTCAQ